MLENSSITRGRFRVIGGEFKVDEDGLFTLVGRFDQTGDYNVKNGGIVTVEAGGEVVVDGPVPVRLKQLNVGGVNQAAVQFGGTGTAIYANSAGGNVNLVIQSGGGIIQVTDDGVSIVGLRTGGATNYLGVDADGYIVKASVGGGGDPDPGDPPSGNPDGYIWPADPDVYGISDDFAAHIARGSAEPGVDVMTPVGAPLWAPGAGTILAVQNTPAGATGRYVTLITTEGDWFRFLHNSNVLVSPGDTVEQAQLLAYTGGSGFGSEAHYGPHTHISFKRGYTGAFPGAGALDDFESYMRAV
ncbi:MAG: M23 family metallopeptidase [Microbacterium gubbeenense]